MNETKRPRRKAYVTTSDCVACGCCVKVCPRDAIHVIHGLFARVDETVCIGCGKCARECPASVIVVREGSV